MRERGRPYGRRTHSVDDPKVIPFPDAAGRPVPVHVHSEGFGLPKQVPPRLATLEYGSETFLRTSPAAGGTPRSEEVASDSRKHSVSCWLLLLRPSRLIAWAVLYGTVSVFELTDPIVTQMVSPWMRS
jgi:hypothetical protein